MKAHTFTAKRFATVTDGFIEACNTIDATVASNAKAINLWAGVAAAGIASGAITLDTVKEGLVARFPKAETLGDCGNTVKSRFYSLQRVIKGNAGERLINGEPLNTVARETAPVQEQKAGKRAGKPGSKRASKGTVITPEKALEALHVWADCCLKDVEAAKSMAANVNLASLIEKVGRVSAMLAKPAKDRPVQRVKEGLKRSPGRGVKVAARKAA